MITTRKHRTTAGIATLALALGAAAPASAQPFQLNSAGSTVSGGAKFQQVSSAPRHATDGGLDWGYVAIGSGAASLALIGLGGTVAVNRRQRRGGAPRSTIARVIGD